MKQDELLTHLDLLYDKLERCATAVLLAQAELRRIQQKVLTDQLELTD